MDAGTALRHVYGLLQQHAVRQSEFTMPSAVYMGHTITVRRLDSNARAVCASDLHFLMYATTAPGTTAVMRNHAVVPRNKFAIYMSSRADQPMAAALAPPARKQRASSH